MINTCNCTSHNGPIKKESLHVHDYLSEFKTETEKALARKNLGVQDALDTFKKNIDDTINKLYHLYDAELVKLELLDYVTLLFNDGWIGEPFTTSLHNYINEAVEKIKVHLAGVPIYDLEMLDEYKNELPDKYITIPNVNSLPTEKSITYTSELYGTYVDILFSAVRALLAEVTKLRNTFYYGILSLNETNTTNAHIIADTEEEELEPLWAMDPEDLDEITNASISIDESCLLDHVSLWTFNSDNNYIQIEGNTDSVSTPVISGYDTEDSYIAPKVIFYSVIDPTASDWEFHINFNTNNPIKIEDLLVKQKISIMFVVSRRIQSTETTTYNKNFYWISIQNASGDTILLKYFTKDFELTNNELDYDTIEVFDTISMKHINLYQLNFYTKELSFSNLSNTLVSTPTSNDYIFRPAHITIRSVSNKTVLDEVAGNLLDNELVFCADSDTTKRGLYIKYNNSIEKLVISGSSSSGGGSEEGEDTPTTTAWVFGNQFPIRFTDDNKQWVFGLVFPIIFN